jgi:nucleotide-binding universal stress UspA family protein
MDLKEPIRHILVAHDFERDSDVALDYAIALARALGARVTILHTYEIPSMGAPEVLVLATDWVTQIGSVAQEALAKVVDRVRDPRVSITAELRQGVVWREVDALAKERHVDLIVVGSHGRRGLPRALLGSVAEKIVRTAPCPVLVVRGPGAEGAAR